MATDGVDEGELIGAFPRNYEARIVSDDSPQIAAIEKVTGVVRDSVTVEIEVAGKKLRRLELKGERMYDRALQNCLFTTPKPNVLGVRSYGVAYAVNCDGSYEHYRLEGLSRALLRLIPDHVNGRLFLADSVHVVCFDGQRVVWQSRRIALDYIYRLFYENGFIYGMGDDIDGSESRFRIDAMTGEVIGGLEPPPKVRRT